MTIVDSELIHINQGNSPKTSGILPIIMCTWQREEGFQSVVEQLNIQDFQDFHLFVWNNNPEKNEFFESTLREKSKFNATIYNSKKNIGGFGRFYLARHLQREKFKGFCVFIDDDQTFGKDSLSIFIKEANKREISSQWAWKLRSLEYYGADNRINVNGGETVDYCGTGGMVCDLDIFKEDALFECPQKYWFIEDLWLSFYANHYKGYILRKSSANFINGSDEHNLFDKVKHLKSPMVKDLVENYGWKITYNKNKIK